ncbi:uncharacterized protein MONBRDRAFT_5577 [Monosiga brevicollis MX1]|uniref:Transmembrane protein n=1 Tax=Monosiga brevicollis TaxID=81824 RepID=A9URV1_MONBE|nr:uncharacterized protein MONBRDRAFT_5577 [Monosiga brevicollis MX1]EDQ91990.1 predicted protein [Monosiga brevicollis MX1]|eukprot:XP_001743276.1 hypothetical protein [Monosiga brevicollis MX1]
MATNSPLHTSISTGSLRGSPALVTNLRQTIQEWKGALGRFSRPTSPLPTQRPAEVELIDQPDQPPSIRYRDDHNRTSILDARDICALSVIMFTDPGRQLAQGHVMIVKTVQSLNLQQWTDWIKGIVLFFNGFLLLTLVTGPITAFVLLALAVHKRSDLDAIVTSSYELKPKQWADIKCRSAVILIWINLSRFFFYAGWTTLGVWLFLSGAIMVVLGDRVASWFRLPDQFRYIQPNYPIMITYAPAKSKQDYKRLSQLLRFRDSVLDVPEYARRMRHISIGSYWTETIMSVLVYHNIYNSISFRRYLYVFVTYILPVVFTFQVLYTTWPHISRHHNRFISSVNADMGVVSTRYILRSMRATIYLPALPQFVQNFFEWLGDLTDWATAWTAYVTGFIVPIDALMVYFKAKFEPIQRLCIMLFRLIQPLLVMVYAALEGSHRALLPMFRVLFLFGNRVVSPIRLFVRATAMQPVHEVREFMRRYFGMQLAYETECDRLIRTLPAMRRLGRPAAGMEPSHPPQSQQSSMPSWSDHDAKGTDDEELVQGRTMRSSSLPSRLPANSLVALSRGTSAAASRPSTPNLGSPLTLGEGPLRRRLASTPRADSLKQANPHTRTFSPVPTHPRDKLDVPTNAATPTTSSSVPLEPSRKDDDDAHTKTE